MGSSARPMPPVRRGRWMSALVTVAAATVTGALAGPFAPVAWAAGAAPPAAVQHAVTARSATPRSASVTGPGGVGGRLLDAPAAATISQGSFVGAPAHTANDLSTWTTVSRPIVDVPAGSTAVDTITVAIPATASPGERYAVVWAEVRSAKAGG